jgi:hypothetical protein
MSQGSYRLKYEIEDKASPILGRVTNAAQLNDKELQKLASDVEGLGNELVRTSPALDAYGQSFDEMGKNLGLSSKKLVELNSKLTNSSEALEEQTQKIIDARNKLDEFGASQDDQNRIIGQLIANSGRYNLTVGKQALVLEELAIELQDAALAEKHLADALEYTAKMGGRAEDAIATYTEAVKGDTAALAKLGPAAAAAADNLDQIRDKQLRAAETMRIFTQETNRAPGVVDKLNDSYNLGAARVQMFWARLGVLGPALLSVAGGALAVAAAVGKIVFDRVNHGLEVYIEKNKEAKLLQDFTAQAADANAQELGKSVHKLSSDYDLAAASSTSFFDKYLTGASRILQNQSTYSKEFKALWGVEVPTLFGPALDLIGRLGTGTANTVLHVDKLSHLFSALASPIKNTFNASQTLTETFNGQRVAIDQLTLSLSTYGAQLDEIARKAQGATPYLDAKGGFDTTGSSAEFGRGAFGRGGGGGVASRDPYGAANDVFGLRVVQVFQGRANLARAGTDGVQTLDRLVGVLGALAQSVDRLAASSGLEDVAGAAGRAGVVGDQRRTADFNERAGLVRDVGATRLREELGIGDVFGATEPQLDAARRLREEVRGLGEDLSQLATGATAQATTGMIKLFAALGTGQAKVKDFGAAFLGQMGEILTGAGEGMVLLGLGVQQIQAGILTPGALIAIGAGAIIAGEALGAASKGSAKGGGERQASITRDAFRESTDRFLEERGTDRQAIVIYNYIGEEQLDGPVARSVQRAERQGFLRR